MKPRKKNSFFAFIFSFVPGATEMYLGFMKNGISILTLFCVPLLFAVYGAEFISIISGIVYVAAFFHARNIATAPEEEFNSCKDKYIWEEFADIKIPTISDKTYRKWAAIILIFVGISCVWGIFCENIYRLLEHYTGPVVSITYAVLEAVPTLVFAAIAIIIGVMMIKGKKKELIEENTDGEK